MVRIKKRAQDPSRRRFLKGALKVGVVGGAAFAAVKWHGVLTGPMGRSFKSFLRGLDREAIEKANGYFLNGNLPKNVYLNQVESRYFTMIMDHPEKMVELKQAFVQKNGIEPTQKEIEAVAGAMAKDLAQEELKKITGK